MTILGSGGGLFLEKKVSLRGKHTTNGNKRERHLTKKNALGGGGGKTLPERKSGRPNELEEA